MEVCALDDNHDGWLDEPGEILEDQEEDSCPENKFARRDLQIRCATVL